MPLFIIEMRSAVLVAERVGLHRTCSVSNFHRLDISCHSMHAVAAHSFVIDQLHRGTGRHIVEVVVARERIFETFNYRRRKMLLESGVAEAVATNLEGEAHRADGVAD